MRAATLGALSSILVALVAGCAAGAAGPPASSTSMHVGPPSALPTAAATAFASASESATSAPPTWPPTSPGSDPTPTASVAASGTPRTEWQLDLFAAAGMRYEYPDPYACTATSVQITLNFIAFDGAGDGDGAAAGTGWSATTSYAKQEEILKYERANMTLPVSAEGSDPHGTRNAINYFGWGSLQAGVYKDASFATFGQAAKSIVSSIARTRRPAIIFPWFGGHSQVVTGYRAHGENPATSDDFTVEGVYLTDPLLGYTYLIYGGVSHEVAAIRPDTYVSLADWQHGADAIRFTAYEQTDSTLRDPIDGQIGKKEWYRKWVAVLSV
jgi:hypothetical protein